MLTVLFLSFHGRMPCSHVINNEVMKRAIHPNEKMPVYWPRSATSKITKTVKVRSHELVLSDVLCRSQNWENVQTSDVRPRYVNLI